MNTWFLKSFRMTKEKSEWLVVPLIMIFSFVVGMLQSIALGIAISTFLFVASFYRTGVVKFIDTGKSAIDGITMMNNAVFCPKYVLYSSILGLLVRSTVERSAQDSAWLGKTYIADKMLLPLL